MEQKKVSPNRFKKQQIVAKLSDKLAKSKGLVFANYQGLTHKQLEKLKKAIKQANAELVVTKNTLLHIALGKAAKEPKETKETQGKKTSGSSVPSVSSITSLEGPTATLFLYADPIEPLRQLAHTIKELNLPTIKLGIIDGKNLTSDEVMKLAALPPYNVLITQLLFQIKAPIYRLHRALGWNIQKLVMTLNAIHKTKTA